MLRLRIWNPHVAVTHMTPVRVLLVACALSAMMGLAAEAQTTAVTRPEERVTLVTRSFAAPSPLVFAAFTEARQRAQSKPSYGWIVTWLRSAEPRCYAARPRRQ